jgi:hypothetical protein
VPTKNFSLSQTKPQKIQAQADSQPKNKSKRTLVALLNKKAKKPTTHTYPNLPLREFQSLKLSGNN